MSSRSCTSKLAIPADYVTSVTRPVSPKSLDLSINVYFLRRGFVLLPVTVPRIALLPSITCNASLLTEFVPTVFTRPSYLNRYLDPLGMGRAMAGRTYFGSV